jgi:acetylcholinesterase
MSNGSQVGPHCIGVGEAISASAGEDCLFVNVFTPSSVTESSNLPVWVHIQGGGYAENAGPNYNGEDIIQQSGGNIIFVEGNYRVGALGFLASEKIRENGDLNVGLLDQRALLNWVQLNIQKVRSSPVQR